MSAVKDYGAALCAFVLADAEIAAAAGARMYSRVLPQNTKQDSIAYQLISAEGDHHNAGASGFARPRIQITAWSQTDAGADVLGRLIKGRLDGYRGLMGTGANEIKVHGVFFSSGRDLYDNEAKLHGVSQDFFIMFAER